MTKQHTIEKATSSRPSSTEITLAGKVYKLTKPLTLWQSRDIGIGCASAPIVDPALEYKRLFDSALNIVSTALINEHPEMTVDAILNSDAIPGEIWDGMDAVLVFAGLQGRAAKGAGKESGEAPAAST